MAKKPAKLNNVFKWLTGTVQVILIIALVVIAVGSFSTRIPFLAQQGLSFFAVTSGSMEPTIPVGALIYSGKYRADDLAKNDIITYRVRNPETNELTTVTHRITKVIKEDKIKTYTDPETEEEKEKVVRTHEFVTKGDANNTEDARTVPVDNVIGLYQWHLPYLGYVTHFAQTPIGFVLLVIIPAVVLIVWESASLVLHFTQGKQKKSAQEIAKLKKELAQVKKEQKN
ncbi:MAG: signal peptidase I [Candidatus Pacebacteria bacterium]|nr:signal peptidase I [Candidatus Paceibacterota bacterium]